MPISLINGKLLINPNGAICLGCPDCTYQLVLIKWCAWYNPGEEILPGYEYEGTEGGCVSVEAFEVAYGCPYIPCQIYCVGGETWTETPIESASDECLATACTAFIAGTNEKCIPTQEALEELFGAGNTYEELIVDWLRMRMVTECADQLAVFDTIQFVECEEDGDCCNDDRDPPVPPWRPGGPYDPGAGFGPYYNVGFDVTGDEEWLF